MNPEVEESEYIDTTTTPGYTVETNAPVVEVETPTTSEATEQAKQIWDRVYLFLSGLPEYLSEFFGEYQRPLTTLGLIFGAFVAVKLVFALLDAINDIPLLAPTFELIGMSYAAWFVYRYLWQASSRQELVTDFNSLKDQVLGGKSLPK